MKRFTFTWVAAAALLCSLKLFAQPDTLWTRELPHGEARLVFEANDGGILVVLNRRWGDTLSVIMMVKLSAAGDSLWSVPIELRYPLDYCVSGGMFENGDLLLSGWSIHGSAGFQFESRVNQAAEIVWMDTLVFDGTNPFLTSAWLPDSSEIRVSNREVPDSIDFAATRISVNGDTLWRRFYSPCGGEMEYYNVLSDQFGRTFVVGSTSALSDVRGFMLCLDANGDTIWTRRTTENECASYYGALATGVGTLVAIEYDECESHCNFLKLDQEGQIVWRHSYVTPDDDLLWPSEVRVARSGGYFSAAATYGGDDEGWLFRFSENGEPLWAVRGLSTWYDPVRRLNAMEFSSGGFLLIETVERQGFPFGVRRVLLTRYAPDTVSPIEHRSDVAHTFSLYSNFPNPFNAVTVISFDLPRAMQTSLKVYDVLGREVAELAGGVMNAGAHTLTFDASALSSGVYFYRLEAGEFGETRKMALLK